MKSLRRMRSVLGALFLLGLTAPTVMALLRWNDGREEIYLVLNTAVGWDSNIFASADARSDAIFTAAARAEYERRAGIIGINASVGAEVGTFFNYSDENYVNPRASVELLKKSGRTTGSAQLGISKESRADVAANIRAESWNTDAAVKVRYPVIRRYSIAGSLGYNFQDFTNNALLVDLATYTAAADLLYARDSKHDLFAGYRLRLTDSQLDTSSYDHAFTLGITGRIAPKLNGIVRVGYQFRDTRGPVRNEDFSGLNAGIAVTWTLTRRLNMTGQISKDFSTTSTDISNDSFIGSLEVRTNVNPRLNVFGSFTYGINDFLGTRGAGRRDEYASIGAGGKYTLNDRISLSLTATHLENSSNVAIADYDRDSVILGLNCRF
ncbi:MAG: outer membrane beta-barrel protein [Opitutaceae bacterium]|nr:outer membrane beta-barrel protein [Opitutaceae bacterium]